jgi:hypothetical protein
MKQNHKTKIQLRKKRGHQKQATRQRIKINDELLLPIGIFSSLMTHMAEMSDITTEKNIPGVSPIIFIKVGIPTERQRKALEVLESIDCTQQIN